MKNVLAVTWWVMALAGLLIIGCNKNNGSGPADDGTTPPTGISDERLARLDLANTFEFGNNDEVTIDDQELQPTDYGTFGKIDAAITPLRWGRFVTRVVRTTTDTVRPGDSIAVIHIHKLISGILKIRALRDTSTVLIEKNFVDSADHNIIFRRFAHGQGRFWWLTNWLPIATSLVDGRTISPNNINITAIELDTPNDTISVTDPLNFYLRYPWRRILGPGRKDIPEFNTAARVLLKATVVSSSPDTDVVALRFGMDRFHKRRIPMQCVSQIPLGANSYQRVFQTQFTMHIFPGFFHVGVDALTRETLYDDQAPYSASWWGIPYRVL